MTSICLAQVIGCDNVLCFHSDRRSSNAAFGQWRRTSGASSHESDLDLSPIHKLDPFASHCSDPPLHLKKVFISK